jgi:hypothetical protein
MGILSKVGRLPKLF